MNSGSALGVPRSARSGSFGCALKRFSNVARPVSARVYFLATEIPVQDDILANKANQPYHFKRDSPMQSDGTCA